jgi:hypothetical protein
MENPLALRLISSASILSPIYHRSLRVFRGSGDLARGDFSQAPSGCPWYVVFGPCTLEDQLFQISSCLMVEASLCSCPLNLER